MIAANSAVSTSSDVLLFRMMFLLLVNIFSFVKGINTILFFPPICKQKEPPQGLQRFRYPDKIICLQAQPLMLL
jgi:hypothetical protein